MRPSKKLSTTAVSAVLGLALLATGAAPSRAAGVTGVRAAGPAYPSSGGTFRDALRTDARFFPLKPGTQFVYDGTVRGTDGIHHHQVIFTVTDLVKRINGVTTRVIWDQDIDGGGLIEAELAFFAQDSRGNVWTMGEYPEEYKRGRFVGAPRTWISGRAGAAAGILVPGHPRTGTTPFVQGRAPAVGFYDVGRVVATGERVCGPTGCYPGVVEIDEWGPLVPADGHQLKFYAPGVGLVRIDATGGGSKEVLQLIRIRHLDQRELGQARAAALRLDRHAYQVAAVYRQTPRVHRDASPSQR